MVPNPALVVPQVDSGRAGAGVSDGKVGVRRARVVG